MVFFSSTQPILRRKQEALDVQDLEGLLKIEWKILPLNGLSGFYTRIDQIFLIWGAITVVIFATAQFMPISWVIQTILWSGLTLLGSIATVQLSWYWVSVEQLRWVVYLWVTLMLGGIGMTNLGIFGGWWLMLPYLCPLWLGLSALGYLGTAWGLRSRAFLFMALFHVVGIGLLPFVMQWQYLITGLLTAVPLFLLAEVQWDMESLSSYPVLTEEQKQFNHQQRHLRLLKNLYYR
jgi:hypothetical protein